MMMRTRLAAGTGAATAALFSATIAGATSARADDGARLEYHSWGVIVRTDCHYILHSRSVITVVKNGNWYSDTIITNPTDQPYRQAFTSTTLEVGDARGHAIGRLGGEGLPELPSDQVNQSLPPVFSVQSIDVPAHESVTVHTRGRSDAFAARINEFKRAGTVAVYCAPVPSGQATNIAGLGESLLQWGPSGGPYFGRYWEGLSYAATRTIGRTGDGAEVRDYGQGHRQPDESW
jgi:hypothetical protein